VRFRKQAVNLGHSQQPFRVPLFVRPKAALKIDDEFLCADPAVFVLGQIDVAEQINRLLILLHNLFAVRRAPGGCQC